MNTVITLVIALIILALLFALFSWVKTPYYRVDRQRMIKVLEMVLTGQATENDWYLVFSMTIRHDPELEEIRQQAADIEEMHFIGSGHSDYLFSKDGLVELEKLLQQLKTIH